MSIHKNNEKMAMSDMFLPDEMILEILSWLPVKSLLKFKCVCKIWCSTIENPVFIAKYMKQARYEMVYEEDQGTEFNVIITIKGIALERQNSNNTYRLRNPATRQILNLPSARERKGICTSMCYIQPTNKVKVVYIDFSKQGDREVLIYNVLRVGTHFTWKRLDSPLLGNLKDVQPSSERTNRVVGSVFYNIMRLRYNLYIDCLDLENETVTSTEVPLHLFCKWSDVWPVKWNGKLSFARIEQEKLNIRVLENYKNHKWADSKIVISLEFLSDNPSPIISVDNAIPYGVEGNLVYWKIHDFYWIFSFDTQSKEVKWLTPLSTKRKLVYMYKPNLLPLRFKVEHTQSQKERTQRSLFFRFASLLRICLLGA